MARAEAIINARADLIKLAPKLLEFAAQVARMADESEIKGGGDAEDHIATLNALIDEARKLTGIDPGYEKLYCLECGVSREGCSCDEDDDEEDSDEG